MERVSKLVFFLVVLTAETCASLVAPQAQSADRPTRPIADFCGPCDAPDMPLVGHQALLYAHGDAYQAIAHLLPAAEAGEMNAQISVAFIMQDWLNGHLRGRSKEPFSWRESWVWWHVVAYKNAYMASLLGGAYSQGAHGLPQNERLGHCLGLRDARPVSDRVADCFRQFGS